MVDCSFILSHSVLLCEDTIVWGFPGDSGSIPGSGSSPGGGMAPHCSALAWRIPWTEEPGRLQSLGSHRVGYD